MYSGVFWIIDPDNVDSSREYCFLIPTSPEGKVDNDGSLNAKSGITYNHEKLWNSLPRSMTRGKRFDHFPRGRVQIRNGVAKVFYNPSLDSEDFRRFITDRYNLLRSAGIVAIKWHPDFSRHYRSDNDN